MSRIVVASSNEGKIREIHDIIGNSIGSLECLPKNYVDIPEIQDWSVENISRKKAVDYYNHLISEEYLEEGEYVMVDDTGLFIKDANGFPGPYVKDFLKKTPLTEICRKYSCSEVEATMSIVLYNGEKMIVATKTCNGIIPSAPMPGPYGFGWDDVFVPEGFEHSYSQLKNKNDISPRGYALREIANKFSL